MIKTSIFTEWFLETSEILQRYQDEVTKQENDEWNKARAEILKGMTSQIADLEAADKKADLEFLRHIYK